MNYKLHPVLGLILLLFFMTGCQRDRAGVATGGPFVTATEENFEQVVLESPQPVLVDFWATWCVACRQLAPVIDELASEYEGRVTVAKLDIDQHPSIAEEYGVSAIPTLLFFRDGKLVDQMVGVQPKQRIAAKLTELLEDPPGV